MSEIRNLTRNGETFYPLTHVEGLINRDGEVVGEINDIFDISEYNASGTPSVLAEYVTLSLALAAVPSSKQKGGMTIRYIDSNDNKYVQYRLMTSSWSTNESDWQGVDVEPIAGSHNLVESGGVHTRLATIDYKIDEELNREVTDVDLSTQTRITGWPSSNNVFSSAGNHIVLDVEGISKVTIKSNENKSCFYALLKDTFEGHDIPATSYVPYLCEGETGRREITANSEVTFAIPFDCKYLCIGISSSDENIDNYKPQKVTLGKTGDVIKELDELEHKVDELKFDVDEELNREVTDVNLSTQPRITGWPSSNNVFSSAGNHITLDVEGISKVTIKSNENKSCFYALLKDTFEGHDIPATSYVPYLCEGEIGRREIAVNSEETITIPFDCKYLCIGISSSDENIDNYKPQKVTLGKTGDVIKQLDELEHKVDELKFDVDEELNREVTDVNLSTQPRITGWLLATNRFSTQGNHITLDVEGISKATIKAHATLSCFYALLKETLEGHEVPPESFIPYLCEGETGRREITANSEVTFAIPFDCKYLCIGISSTDEGQDNYKPQKVTLGKTGDVIKQLDELEENVDTIGRTVNGSKLIIDVANETRHDGWVTDGSSWSNYGTGGSHITLDVADYKKLSITANSGRSAVFFFAKSDFVEPTGNTDYSQYLCAGETGRRTVPAGSTQEFSIPYDCKFICIGIISSQDYDYSPSNVVLSSQKGLEQRIDELKFDVDEELNREVTDVNLSTQPRITGWPSSDNIFSSAGNHITLDVEGISKVTIKSNENKSCFYALLKDTFEGHDIPATSYVPYLCEGEIGRREIAVNSEETITIPFDCKYLCIGISSSDVNIDNYKPQKVTLGKTGDVIKQLDELEEDVDTIHDDIRPTIKILSIGNSFSRDSLSYVPAILQSIMPNIRIVIGILCKGSCSLQMHWENRALSDYYTFNIFKTEDGAWTSESDKGLDYGLTYDNWDIITLQQNSRNSVNYTTYQPYLNNLIDYIAGKCHNYKLGWILTHSWANGYSVLTDWEKTSEQMSDEIRIAAKSVMDETPFEVLFPYGTAIQNARRNNILDAIGDGGELCYSDKVHLQEGIGCQVAAYANTITLLNYLSAKGINGNTIRVDAAFLTQWNIPEQHGSAVGSTDANCLIAQKCAIMAIKNPYELIDV